MTIADLNYEVHGNPDGPTMLMVHGFLSSNVQWDLNIDRLGAALRLVLVELPGHGSSAAPDDPAAYGLEAVTPAFDAIRTAVGVDQWWVCGQSLGAAISLHYVLSHADRVRGVVVTNTRAAFGHGRSDPSIDYRTIDLREIPFHPINARRFPEDLKGRMVERADAIEPYVLNHTISHRSDWPVVDRLHELAMPVMLVNGRFERVFQPLIDDARHALHQLEIVHLDGGHSINVEQPEAFDAAVLDFVSRHS